MIRVLNAYLNTVKPTGKFVGMSYIGGKLKVAFDTHTDIATMVDGVVVVTKE